MSAPRQGDVFWANLDPAVGREIRKRRPVLVVSPDEMNRSLATVIAAPITTTIRAWPSRCPIRVGAKTSSVALDRIRCLDVRRLVQHIARVDARPALRILQDMFA